MSKLLSLALIPIIVWATASILSKSNFDLSTQAYATIPYNFTNISGIYRIPQLGFQITFPPGWSGIGLNDFVMVSPMGINSKTAVPNPSSDIDKAIIVLSVANLSDIMDGLKDRNISSYQQYVEKTSKTIGCQIISDKFVKFNGTNTEEVDQLCGSRLEQKAKTYAIASGKTVVFVGLKGNGPAFDHNLKKFDESLQTIKINKVTNIKRLLSGAR
jgi:hypothetical protein